MKTIRKDQIREALGSVGLAAGQTVYLQADLRTPGRIENVRSRDAFCQAYYDAIRDLIGDEGTLVVPTYTTQVARYDIDYIHEETPSLMGVFSEFVRLRPDSVRSIHPIHSLTAVGRRKDEICRDNGPSDFGLDSPFDRLLSARAKIVSIGLESGYVVGIAHHLEAACCLPFVYNKLLKWRPFVSGRKIEGHCFSTVRHLKLTVDYDLTGWVKHMRRLGGVNSARIGDGWIHMADYAQVFSEGARLLKQDPYFFLKRPPDYVYGEIPFDGPTSTRDKIAEDGDAEKVSTINWGGFYLMKKNFAGGDEQELD